MTDKRFLPLKIADIFLFAVCLAMPALLRDLPIFSPYPDSYAALCAPAVLYTLFLAVVFLYTVGTRAYGMRLACITLWAASGVSSLILPFIRRSGPAGLSPIRLTVYLLGSYYTRPISVLYGEPIDTSGYTMLSCVIYSAFFLLAFLWSALLMRRKEPPAEIRKELPGIDKNPYTDTVS